MDIFFNWHSSEHDFDLDVKWNPRDEIQVRTPSKRSSEGPLVAAHSHGHRRS